MHEKSEIPEMLVRFETFLKRDNPFFRITYDKSERRLTCVLHNRMSFVELLMNNSGGIRLIEETSDKYGLGGTNRAVDFALEPSEPFFDRLKAIWDTLHSQSLPPIQPT